MNDPNKVFQVIRNLENLSSEVATSGSRLKAVMTGTEAAANALAKNADGVIETFKEMTKERAEYAKNVRAEQRRYERLADAVRLYVASVEKGSAKQSRQALSRLSRVLGNGGSVEVPARSARMALWALARSESWGLIKLATGSEQSALIVRDVVTYNGGSTERHPREAARLVLKELFDVDVDSASGHESFLEMVPWDDDEDD